MSCLLQQRTRGAADAAIDIPASLLGSATPIQEACGLGTAGRQEKDRTQVGAVPLPIAARRRLWDALWERLLAPAPGECHDLHGNTRSLDADGGHPQTAVMGNSGGEAA